MTWQQYLTEKVLRECWHDGTSILMAGYHCKKCDKIFSCNRTYSTEADTMELYRQIEKDGKWDDFVKHTSAKWGENVVLYMVVEEAIADYIAWLFCLDGKGYEDRCKIVSEFYGWEAAND